MSHLEISIPRHIKKYNSSPYTRKQVAHYVDKQLENALVLNQREIHLTTIYLAEATQAVALIEVAIERAQPYLMDVVISYLPRHEQVIKATCSYVQSTGEQKKYRQEPHITLLPLKRHKQA